jgi:hypothetical protein
MSRISLSTTYLLAGGEHVKKFWSGSWSVIGKLSITKFRSSNREKLGFLRDQCCIWEVHEIICIILHKIICHRDG